MIYSINTVTTGTVLYVLMPISITTCILACISSIYIVHQSSIIVTSICFRNISENFPNIYKEKNLNGLRYLLQKKYSEVSAPYLLTLNDFFFMNYFIGQPVKSQM